MTRIRRMRLVLPARFARNGGDSAREIAERLIDSAHDAGAQSGGTVHLTDTGQTAAQIGLQAAFVLRGRATKDGGGS